MRRLPFYAAILLTAFLVYVYPVNALNHLLFGGRVLEPWSAVPALAVGLAMIVYTRTRLTSPALRAFLHYGLGIGFIGFCVMSAGLLLSVALPDLSRGIGLAALAVVAAASAWGLANGRSLHLKELAITSPKIKKAVKLAFISDIHLGSNPPRHLARIRSVLDGLDYDFLLIGGDLFDSSDFEPADVAALDGLGKPVLFVTGNHEFYTRGHEAKIAGLAEYGITLLDDRSERLEGVNIVGVDDNKPAAKQAETARGLVRKGEFNLAVVHRPSCWEGIAGHADLMLSGHTHNGQIFPFNHLVRTRYREVYGLYESKGSTLYVSSGSGCWGPKMRLGTRNEVVRITISPG